MPANAHTRRLAAIFIVAALLVTLTAWPLNIQAQVQVTIELDILKSLVDVNMTTDANSTLELEGVVNITKPPSRLIVVQVSLGISAPTCLTVSVEPSIMSFPEPGSMPFVLRVGIPAALKNVSELTITVIGTATTTALPTETAQDSVKLAITNPPQKPPPKKPDGDGSSEEVLGPQVAMMCGVSVLVGAVVGGLLVLKGRHDRKRRTQVIYVKKEMDDNDQGRP